MSQKISLVQVYQERSSTTIPILKPSGDKALIPCSLLSWWSQLGPKCLRMVEMKRNYFTIGNQSDPICAQIASECPTTNLISHCEASSDPPNPIWNTNYQLNIICFIALILDLDLGLAMFISSFLLYTKINVVTILSPIFVKLWSKYLANFILWQFCHQYGWTNWKISGTRSWGVLWAPTSSLLCSSRPLGSRAVWPTHNA